MADIVMNRRIARRCTGNFCSKSVSERDFPIIPNQLIGLIGLEGTTNMSDCQFAI